jgi:hypothetical protein
MLARSAAPQASATAGRAGAGAQRRRRLLAQSQAWARCQVAPSTAAPASLAGRGQRIDHAVGPGGLAGHVVAHVHHGRRALGQREQRVERSRRRRPRPAARAGAGTGSRAHRPRSSRAAPAARAAQARAGGAGRWPRAARRGRAGSAARAAASIAARSSSVGGRREGCRSTARYSIRAGDRSRIAAALNSAVPELGIGGVDGQRVGVDLVGEVEGHEHQAGPQAAVDPDRGQDRAAPRRTRTARRRPRRRRRRRPGQVDGLAATQRRGEACADCTPVLYESSRRPVVKRSGNSASARRPARRDRPRRTAPRGRARALPTGGRAGSSSPGGPRRARPLDAASWLRAGVAHPACMGLSARSSSQSAVRGDVAQVAAQAPSPAREDLEVVPRAGRRRDRAADALHPALAVGHRAFGLGEGRGRPAAPRRPARRSWSGRGPARPGELEALSRRTVARWRRPRTARGSHR